MTDDTILDLADGAQLSAANLREVWPHMDDETIKRKILTTFGWVFSRQSGMWFRPDEPDDLLSPEHGLEYVCLGPCALPQTCYGRQSIRRVGYTARL